MNKSVIVNGWLQQNIVHYVGIDVYGLNTTVQEHVEDVKINGPRSAD